MYRNEIKERLTAYRRRWLEEAETVARFEAFIDSHPDGFERSCRVGHITGSAWIVNRSGERVLLAHHRKLGRWLQTGGHSDGNPDFLEVVLREACEESDLDVRALDEAIFDLDVHLIRGRGCEPAHYHYDVPLPRPGDGRAIPGERGVLRSRLGAGGQGGRIHEPRIRASDGVQVAGAERWWRPTP